MDRGLVALTAMLLSAVFDMRRLSTLLTTPALNILHDVEQKLNRPERTAGEREARGTFLVVLAVVASIIAGFGIRALFGAHAWVAEALILSAALPINSVFRRTSSIRTLLSTNDLTEAKLMLGGTPYRHYALLDEHGVARAAIEILAVEFTEKIAGRIFWYVCFGLPGLFIACSISFLQSTLTGPEVEVFSRSARWSHEVLQWLPSRIVALLWMVASLFMPSFGLREAARHIFPTLPAQSFYVVTLVSAAAVLKLSLGGPASPYMQQWAECGTAKATASDMKQALWAMLMMHLLIFILLWPLL